MNQTRADKPRHIEKPRVDIEDRLEYRIICNSEHFVVVNPAKRVKKKKQKVAEPRRKGKLLLEREL